jgi:hypothetical protein
MAFETYRSRERQQLLFQQKVTKLQNVGVHHYGLAADIVRSVGGHPSWKGDFSIMGRLARKHGLVWGGDWGRPGVKPSFVDPVHVQRCTVGRQKLLFDGTWYPDEAYDPWDELTTAVRRGLRRRPAKQRTRKAGTRGDGRTTERETKNATKRAARLSAKRSTKGIAKRTDATKRPPKRTKLEPPRVDEAKEAPAPKKGAPSRQARAKRTGANRSGTKRSSAKRSAKRRGGRRRLSFTRARDRHGIAVSRRAPSVLAWA